jgi:hypothetical protein
MRTTAFASDYVALDSSGATWVAHSGIRLVGIDYLSIAVYEDLVEPHRTLFRAVSVRSGW